MKQTDARNGNTLNVSLPLFRRGKVRDMYVVDDARLLMVASDRVSAFDVVMNEPIPGKGAVLTALTAFWLHRTAGIVANHLLSDDPADMPHEFRGDESRRHGPLADEPLPPGLRESERLEQPRFTPAVKAESGHDENISRARL